MKYPEFFKDVKKITLKDPLSDVLGTFEEGVVEFCYLDVVKMAGHSCPTVAGAYLMSIKALDALYGDNLPVRGEIKVYLKEDEKEGVTGVIANVISLITGATKDSGFKGLGGKFARHSLMSFNENIPSIVRFERVDTKEAVDVYYDHKKVPSDPNMPVLMQKVLSGLATDDEKKLFGRLWQNRVKSILIDHFDDEDVCKVDKV